MDDGGRRRQSQSFGSTPASTSPKKFQHPTSDALRRSYYVKKEVEDRKFKDRFPLPGSAEKERQLNPFLPNNFLPHLLGVGSPVTTPVNKARPARGTSEKERRLKESLAVEASRQALLKAGAGAGSIDAAPAMTLPFIMNDAETGAPLTVSTATWDTKEGKIDLLNPELFVRMGTGRNTPQVRLYSPLAKEREAKKREKVVNLDDLKKSLLMPSLARTPSVSFLAPPEEVLAAADDGLGLGRSEDAYLVQYPHRHPLVSKFMKEGPQRTTSHVLWQAVDGQVHLPFDARVTVEDSDHESDEGREAEVVAMKNIPSPIIQISRKSITVDTNADDLSVQSQLTENEEEAAKKREEEELKRQLEIQRAAIEAMKQEHDQLIKDTERTLHDQSKWQALEAKFFKDLSVHALQLERNKIMTKEAAFPGGVEGVKKACEKMAKMRANSLKTLAYAVADENKREELRRDIEEKSSEASFLEIMRMHEEERHRKRAIIRIMQYDMEVAAINQMSNLGLLW